MSQLSSNRKEDPAVNPESTPDISSAKLPTLDGKAPAAEKITLEHGKTVTPAADLGKPANQGDPVSGPAAEKLKTEPALNLANLPIIPESLRTEQAPQPAVSRGGISFALAKDQEWFNVAVSRIDGDHNRFRDIVRGKVRENLKKYISQGEMIGKQGKDLVSIPIPQIDPPRFKFGNKGNGGVGSGPGEPGQPMGPGQDGDQPGQAGQGEGQHVIEVEMTLEELGQILGEELELPRIQPRGNKNVTQEKDKYTGIRRTGPESLRHNKRTFKEALKREIASGEYNPDDPVVVPIREDKRYRAGVPVELPNAQAVIMYMMDVSGSMTDQQKEIVRIEAFWLDTWIKAHYKNVETVYIIHDTVAKVVDHDTFFHTRESGGTKISSAYELMAQLIEQGGDVVGTFKKYTPADWNIYGFHFTDGDNWGDDNSHCLKVLEEKLLPVCNLFGYGQVESPYGSGEFMEYIQEKKEKNENLVTSKIPDKDAIMGSIKEFLSKGR